VEREPQDVLAAMRDVLARMPDPDTVPTRIEMCPSLFYRLEALPRHGWSRPSSLFGPFLPIEFDDVLSPSAVRVIYASGRKEIIAIVPPS